MKGINCRNVDKFVHNHNRQVSRALEGMPSSSLKMQNVLGLNSEGIKGHIMFTLSNQEMLYYSSQYFIVHNLTSKDSTVIPKEGCFGHTVIYINRFQSEKKTDIIFTIERKEHCLYVGQLEITDSVTEIDRELQKYQPYSWKISKLTNKYQYSIEDIAYHSAKQYLYLLVSLPNQEKTEKYLWVYDLRRQCMIMSPLIKPSATKIDINRVWVSEDPCEVYLMGKNYFRMWSISFTEKIIKQSNYRNIERALSDKPIIKVFYCHYQNIKVLGVLTDINLILLKRNELLTCLNPPEKSTKERKNKQNIEAELETSLNQICKMKFMFDQQQNEKEHNYQQQVKTDVVVEDQRFRCASDIWIGEHGQSIVIATQSGNLLTYALHNGQIKLIHHLNIKRNHSFDYISVSRKGQIILLSQKNCQNLFIINKYALNSEDKEEELKLFWGMGQINKEDIVSIDSPAAHERICTLGENNTLKLWSFKGKEKKIIFQQKMPHRATHIAMHPCGLLVAVNFISEIKLMSLQPTGVFEVMSAKTNYNSVGLTYSACGNYLVSNERNLLIFYNPFTLKTLGYIEPPELKSKVLDFHITSEGNYITYQTSDYSFYVQPLQLYSYSKYDTILPAHTQIQPYKCFYFDNNVTNAISSKSNQIQTFFVGCTEHKYVRVSISQMVFYKNYGKELIVQYPVQDCFISSLCVADGWLFAATSKGSIRVYKWPIREAECEMEVISLQQKAVKLKHPRFEQYYFWSDQKKIINLHKLGFGNQLVVIREGGIMSVISYHKFHLQKFEEAGQRKKLTQIINDTYFITKNEAEKRNRLIDKTESDILKIQNQIAKEKSMLERKYAEQCSQVEKTFEQKIDLQAHQKNQYLNKIIQENKQLREQIQLKQENFQMKRGSTAMLYQRKKQYEDNRNDNIKKEIQNIVQEHKTKISSKIQSHKKDIGDLKALYRDKVAQMKKQFQQMIAQDYPSLLSIKNVGQQSRSSEEGRGKKCSIRIPKEKKLEDLNVEIKDQEIIQLNERVEEIQRQNSVLEAQLEELKKKVRYAQLEDENLQKQFQKCLEQYNSSRFTNLSLHSEVLKMRTQLLERKQIMQNKQEVINVAYQERQKLQNYKQLVKGSLTKLQERKEGLEKVSMQKENQMTAIFAELASNLNEYERIKREDQRLTTLMQVYQKDKDNEEARIQKAVNRLKELKRYLLLQGLTQDVEQKQMYLEQQNLLTNINFYRKRMSMETMKQKKNKMLKKSALNLVLKQNKNLLEEVNQLREETINHQHEINNLGKKIGEANRMLSIEYKLKDQKTEVKEQRNQLQAIRDLFNNQIASYNQVEEELKNYSLD